VLSAAAAGAALPLQQRKQQRRANAHTCGAAVSASDT